jgi:hypothetical protein
VEGTEQPHHHDYVYALKDEEAYLQADDHKPGIALGPASIICQFCGNSPSRSQEDSSRQSTWSGIPTPRHSRQCGSATNALLGWHRYSPRNPPKLSGCEAGRSGHVAAVPQTCPNHRSAAVIHEQPRSMPMPAEL